MISYRNGVIILSMDIGLKLLLGLPDDLWFCTKIRLSGVYIEPMITFECGKVRLVFTVYNEYSDDFDPELYDKYSDDELYDKYSDDLNHFWKTEPINNKIVFSCERNEYNREDGYIVLKKDDLPFENAKYTEEEILKVLKEAIHGEKRVIGD